MEKVSMGNWWKEIGQKAESCPRKIQEKWASKGIHFKLYLVNSESQGRLFETKQQNKMKQNHTEKTFDPILDILDQNVKG